MHNLGIRYASIPYCYPFKRKIHPCTILVRVRCSCSVVSKIIIYTIPQRALGEDNIDIRAGIVHYDRFSGYIRGVWPGPKKIEALSRRIFNPDGRMPVGKKLS